MVIDLDRCIGCQTCMVSCHMHNSQPPGTWWNRVFTQGAPTHQTAVDRKGELRMDYLPVSCQMCDNPSCQKVCPTGATYTNSHGVVLVDYDRCIGCRYCIVACPYNVRQFNWKDPKKLKSILGDGYEYGYPDDVVEGRRLIYTRHRPTGVVEKCTFCVQYTQEGEDPACVQSCTGRARFFGDFDNPDSKVSKLIQEKPMYRLLEAQNTQPKVYYVSVKKTAV